MFHGREAEIAALDSLLAEAEGGEAGALVLRGEAGIGKSALLSRTAEAATERGFRVLRATGTEAESTLPYAGLHLLLGRARTHLAALPEAQADALRNAFSTGVGQGNSFLVSAATLTLLADIAEDQPLLCLIDDAQWLDPASRDALLFAARRLDAEPIALVFAARDDALPELQQLDAPELHLAGLSETDARKLLTSSHSDLPPATLDWIMRESHGNPLALQALPTLDRPDYSSPYRQPAAAIRIQQAFTAQIARLSPPVRNLLLTAATDASGDSTVIRTAAANLESGAVEHPSVTAADRAAIRTAIESAVPAQPGYRGYSESDRPAIGSSEHANTPDADVSTDSRNPADVCRDAPAGAESSCARMVVVVPNAEALARAGAAVLEAEQAGMLVLEGDRIAFRHPLIRAAAVQSATPAQRRAAHAALAVTLVEAFDDRRAWHLAAAATGPDERAAAALEAAALCARARGGLAETTAAYERAAVLSPAGLDRRRRYAAAAHAATDAGNLDQAMGFVERAMEFLPESTAVQPQPQAIAQLISLKAAIERDQDRPRTAYRTLSEAAAQLTELDPQATGQLMFQAADAAWSAGDLTAVHLTATQAEQLELPAAQRIRALADLIDALNLEPGSHQRGATALRNLTAWIDAEHPRTPAQQVADANQTEPPALTEVEKRSDMPPQIGAGGLPESTARKAVGPQTHPSMWRDTDCLRARVQVVHWHLLMGDMAAARDLASALEEDCRAHGALGMLAPVLWLRARAEILLGQFGQAGVDAAEAMRLAADTGLRVVHSNAAATLALLAAIRGDEKECRALASEPLARGVAPANVHAEAALGLLELGTGRPDAAFDRFLTMFAGVNRHGSTASLPDLFEAAHRVGRTDEARDRLELYTNWAEHTGHGWAMAIAHRCRALFAPEDEAGKHFETAIELHYATAEYGFERARTEVLYGEWLRRRQQRVEARRYLRAATETFERLDARPWAERARNELRATGETRTAAADTDLLTRLTPQERQTVQLAAEGLSNKDIASRLFLSPRTVGYHLSNAYPKLGITSRRELATFRERV
ncbi:AAA family ATPase [Nocardia huaxiensis]|uniref:AAA family ATPase n=1 Tax=Nocardia huaxiensis TaxID=2755382 RepID=A0A7D6V9V1_9NOCA|nr:helix-turn-helix transcriptional regulator [Nocardia huaxiensis]QLY31261.1 AAA family ATPase [Nocardia huaxiensis]